MSCAKPPLVSGWHPAFQHNQAPRDIFGLHKVRRKSYQPKVSQLIVDFSVFSAQQSAGQWKQCFSVQVASQNETWTHVKNRLLPELSRLSDSYGSYQNPLFACSNSKYSLYILKEKFDTEKVKEFEISQSYGVFLRLDKKLHITGHLIQAFSVDY